MGKKAKQNSRKAVNQDDSDGEDDYRSVAGSVDERSSTPLRTRTELSSRQMLSEAVEKLSEKRYTTRESGLEQLIKHFQTSHDSAAELSIDGYQDTILTQLLRSLRRPPSLKEGKLCTQLLSLVGLYLGQDEVEFFSSVEKPLKHLVHATRPELVEMRGNALMCLSFLAFICGGVDAGHRIWSYCEHILRDDGIESDSEDSDSDAESKSSSSDSENNDSNQKQNRDNIAARISLRCAAAKSWVLLATLRSPEEILAHCTCDGSSLLEPLLELLQYYDGANAGAIDIKITAGKCLAYLWEVAGTTLPGGEAEELGRLLAYDHTLVEKILTTINEIAKDSSKRISKKDRKEQRSEFRIIEEGVTKSETPSDTVRMQGAIVDIDSFHKLHIVDVLKEVLGSGFHSSLRLYSVVKDVLEIEYVTSNMDGGGEDLRIGKGSSAGKSRSVYRKQDRRMRQMETTHDGEDFACYGGEED